MADFEATIVAEIGIEALGSVLYAPAYAAVEAGIGVGVSVDYEYVQRGSVEWAKALEDNNDDLSKAAESLQGNLDYWTLKKVSAEKTKLQIERLSLKERAGDIADLSEYGNEAQIWCADLTQDLTGDVGIIEVPGEQTARNIQPGYNANAVYDQTRDGQMLPAIVSTPAATFWNLAMLPGWQKWKLTYRYGTITSIDYGANTCSLDLEAATSTQQGIDVNQGTVLTDVPIEYMYCNAAAFEVDDVVLIKFTDQDYTTPKVIGFKSNPKQCPAWVVFSFWVSGWGGTRYVVWDAGINDFADLSTWGGPAIEADYPCLVEDLTAWIAATVTITDMPTDPRFNRVFDIYEDTDQSRQFTNPVGEYKSGQVDYVWVEDQDESGISLNTGCGSLSYTHWAVWQDFGEGVFQADSDYDYPATVEILSGDKPKASQLSYLLTIVAGLSNAGAKSCYRSHWQQTYSGSGTVPFIWDKDFWTSLLRYTPLGAIGSAFTATWNTTDVNQRIIHLYDVIERSHAVYIEEGMMLQLYFHQMITQRQIYSGGEWIGEEDKEVYTRVACAVDSGPFDEIDPLAQSRITTLEAKLISAMDLAAAVSGDERTVNRYDVEFRVIP